MVEGLSYQELENINSSTNIAVESLFAGVKPSTYMKELILFPSQKDCLVLCALGLLIGQYAGEFEKLSQASDIVRNLSNMGKVDKLYCINFLNSIGKPASFFHLITAQSSSWGQPRFRSNRAFISSSSGGFRRE
jgi:hypothetical protein